MMLLAALSATQSVTAQDNTIVFTPQWMEQAQFAGYYVAEAKGFYREAGVNVRIEHPSASLSAMSRLQKGECQATTLQLCQAMEMIDEGTPLVNVLQTSMNNSMVIVPVLPFATSAYVKAENMISFTESESTVTSMSFPDWFST